MGVTLLMSNVNVALVLVLSACTFEVYGDENCCKKTTKPRSAGVFAPWYHTGKRLLSKKREFLLLIYRTFNRRSHLAAGRWRLCVSPSWPSALEE